MDLSRSMESSLCVCRCSVTKSLWPHGLQHTSLSCPLPSPRVCSNSCSLSQWFNLAISSSAVLFYFCLQSFPASESFRISWLFTSGGQILELQFQHQSFQGIFGVDQTILKLYLLFFLSLSCTYTNIFNPIFIKLGLYWYSILYSVFGTSFVTQQ